MSHASLSSRGRGGGGGRAGASRLDGISLPGPAPWQLIWAQAGARSSGEIRW